MPDDVVQVVPATIEYVLLLNVVIVTSASLAVMVVIREYYLAFQFAALWPIGHAALVARYDVDPWKLAGWAMYTRPTPPLLVALFTTARAVSASGR